MDLEAHLKRQMEFSRNRFGPESRKEAVADHIRQELEEVLEEGNPREWVDLVLLSLDGLWRSIQYSSKPNFEIENLESENREFVEVSWNNVPKIACMLIEEKQSKNEKRTWPDWRKIDPKKAINHDRSKD